MLLNLVLLFLGFVLSVGSSVFKTVSEDCPDQHNEENAGHNYENDNDDRSQTECDYLQWWLWWGT